MNEFPVGADERPLFPPKILSTEVLLNPFEDIVPRESKRAKPEPEKHETKPKSEAVAKRLANSLSYSSYSSSLQRYESFVFWRGRRRDCPAIQKTKDEEQPFL